MWQLFEPYHAAVYFAPEAKVEYEKVGLKGGWMGYFASRAAAMGAVSAEVVTACFYNFHPKMVRRAIPDAWSFSSPANVIAARFRVADAALRRLLGEHLDGAPVVRAADIASRALDGCDPAGRPLFAAHSNLAAPEASHLKLWHAATCLREFRGDGHVASLLADRVDGCGAHVLAAAAGAVRADTQRTFRGWSTEEWQAAEARLRERGVIDEAGELTVFGWHLRQGIEDRTDLLALAPFNFLGVDETEELASLLGLLVRAIVDGGGLPYPNAIGLERTGS